ncbi:hypothetical protein BST10_18790 [Mycolicibacter algericus DSM 45454]|uniref:Uncharacterized protein n=1 Tax=Mycolicibacter algericus DSM 45454 TaxID=723879 RepID=A0ABX3RKG1_MYCAL|nr:hypothetical protein BST10_18790 [Mycolicibacter algericus DSM 45454]
MSDRMSTIGDVVPLTDGRWMIRPPQRCPAGHQLAAGTVLAGPAGPRCSQKCRRSVEAPRPTG